MTIVDTTPDTPVVYAGGPATGRVQNISGRDLVAGYPPRVIPDEGVLVVDAANPYGVFGYTQQEDTWAPFDEPARLVHQWNLDAIAYLVAEADADRDAGVPAAVAAADHDVPVDTLRPNGNASGEEWAAFIVGAGVATAEQIAGLSRNQLRDLYTAHLQQQADAAAGTTAATGTAAGTENTEV